MEGMSDSGRYPDFLVIGAQKAGTSWTWRMLDQHPDSSLPEEKEIHYYGSSELYRKGPDWYLDHFRNLEPGKLTGEASTSHLFDRVPYWFNPGRDIEYDPELPPLPELVHRDMPDARIVVVLRDPVRRAISAYHHWLRKGDLPCLAGLRKTALEHPKLRILEYGHYLRHLRAWTSVYPRDQILVLLYESDIATNPMAGIARLYRFVGLDPDFVPELMRKRVHSSWSWTRCVAAYYSGPLRRKFARGPMGDFLDRHPFLERYAIRPRDVRFLQETYLPERTALEQLLGISLADWDYGAGLLDKS